MTLPCLGRLGHTDQLLVMDFQICVDMKRRNDFKALDGWVLDSKSEMMGPFFHYSFLYLSEVERPLYHTRTPLPLTDTTHLNPYNPTPPKTT